MNNSMLHLPSPRAFRRDPGRLALPALLLAHFLAPAFGQAIYTPYTFTTLAGKASAGSADGPGATARFTAPHGVAADRAGNVYVADSYNNTIRRISSDGMVTTLAGTVGAGGSDDGTGSRARFDYPSGVTVDAAGNLYVADTYNCCIRKITQDGTVTTLAGLAGTYGTSDGSGSAARFTQPRSVAVDGAGNLYVTDDLTVRKISPSGIVSTLASLTKPWGGVAVDTAGSVYACDDCAILKVTSSGVVSTIAGELGSVGYVDGDGSAARFGSALGITVDSTGNVYVADTENTAIRRVSFAGAVSTLAGSKGNPGFADGSGLVAQFGGPTAVVVDSTGNLYVADGYNNTIRKITANGTVTTLAGLAPGASADHVDGPGSIARFNWPSSVAVGPGGELYVADNQTIRKVTPGGEVSTIAGLAGSHGFVDATGTAARFDFPMGVAADAAGNLYVADYYGNSIRKVTPAGVVTTLAGAAGSSGWADGIGSAARLNRPAGIALDQSGTAYVADTGNHRIRKVSPDGMVTTLAGSYRGSKDGQGAAVQFNSPGGVAVDDAGVVYVADTGNCIIRRITPDGTVTTLAGQTRMDGPHNYADGPANAALFNVPQGIAVDAAGNVYVADTGNVTIRRINPAGIVTTLAGLDAWAPLVGAGNAWATGGGSADGTGSSVRFLEPRGIAVDAAGLLYVADSSNNTIRKGSLLPVPIITTQPSSRTVTAGQTVTFSVAATTDGAAQYHWMIKPNSPVLKWDLLDNRGPYAGSNTATLTITGVTAAMNGDAFACAITNVNGTVTTEMVMLTVIGGTPLTVKTLAGLAGTAGSTDGSGSSARFGSPADLAADRAGNVYVADANNHVIRRITPGGAVTTMAGLAGASGSADGTGSAARFHSPAGVAVDTAGTVYVSDTDNHTIRRITPTGAVSTLAGQAEASGFADANGSSARFNSPSGIVVDAVGNVYVADTLNDAVRKILPNGSVTTLYPPVRNAGGPQLAGPQGIALDQTGNLFVADTNNDAIRKLNLASGAMTTVAGQVGISGSDDGAADQAQFHFPSGVALDAAGNLFVADTDNHTIREVAVDGTVSTVAGLAAVNGSADGTGADARFRFPTGIAADSAGNLYVADTDNHTIRIAYLPAAPVITAQPLSENVAAGANPQFSVTATGRPAPTYQWSLNGTAISGATASTLSLANVQASNAGTYTVTVTNDSGSVTSNPATLTVATANPGSTSSGGSGASAGGGAIGAWFGLALAVLGILRHRGARRRTGILVLLPAIAVGQIDSLPYTFTVFAGSPSVGNADGAGDAARFRSPEGLAVDSAGNVYVADSGNVSIRRISPLGVVSTLTGLTGRDGGAVPFHYPADVAVDAAGNLFVVARDSHAIFKVTPTGIATSVADLSAAGAGSGPLSPISVAVDPAGNLYFCCFFDHAIRKIAPGGAVATLAGNAVEGGSVDGPGNVARFSYPEAVAADGAGNLYVAESGNSTVRKITPDGLVSTLAGLAEVTGSADGTGSAARFYYPHGVAVDGSGNVYVADTYNYTVRRIAPDGRVTTLAGLALTPGGQNGRGGDARFDAPFDVAADGWGNVYVSDYWNATVRKISPDGTTTTLAGLSRRNSSADGVGSAAHFSQPTSVAVDAAGSVYVADSANHTIRKITPAGAVITLAGVAGVSGSADGPGSAARFNEPTGVAVDPSGNVLVADYQNHTIRKVTPAGVVTTLAGLAGAYGIADGTGSAARFDLPSGVATDGAGNIYVADTHDNVVWTYSLWYGSWTPVPPSGLSNPCPPLIRRITPDGTVTTIGQASRDLGGVAADPHGHVYYADNAPAYDYDNGISALHRVNADGTATDLGIVLSRPCGLAADDSGIYVAETYNDTISKFTPAGVRTPLVSPVRPTEAGDGTVSLGEPRGVAVDAAGNVYVADMWNNTILKGVPYPLPIFTRIPVNRAVTVGGSTTFTVAVGSTTAATLRWQRQAGGSGAWTDLSDNANYAGTATATLTLAAIEGAMNGDAFRCMVTNAAGSAASDPVTLTVVTGRPLAVTTLAGAAGISGSADGDGSAARFDLPTDLTADDAGNILVADTGNHTIRRIARDHTVATLAGTAQEPGFADGRGAVARFAHPSGVGVDGTGNVYVSDTDNSVIRKISPDGTVTTLAGLAHTPGSADGVGSTARFNGPSGIAADATGDLYVSDTLNGIIRRITPDGTVTTATAGIGPPALLLGGPQGLALDGSGNLYVTNTNRNTVVKLALATAKLAWEAGSTMSGADDGFADTASFRYPSGVAIEAAGNLYVADTDNHTIRLITPNGIVTTIAGLAGASGSADGVGTVARFRHPTGIAVTAAGDLLIADTDNHTIRLAYFAAAPVITAQPLSENVAAGANPQFSVTATGRPTPTYQWSFNGTAITGATGNSITLSNVQPADAGTYTVTVTNDAGSVTSNPATLTVSAAPANPPPSGGTATSGGGTMEAWFAVLLAVLATARAFSRFS